MEIQTHENKLDENGLRHGKWIVMFDNETLGCIGNYSHGEMHGFWMDYHAYNNIPFSPWNCCYFNNSIQEGEHVKLYY